MITFADANSVTYGYDASGRKLSVTYKSGGNTVKTEYAGNRVYKNGALSTILTEEGYVTLSGTTPTYHYFLRDHQGNNRVVLAQYGIVEQVNHYYPFGGSFGEGVQAVNQPYKYNGKELDGFQSLDLYDYGARHYDAALGKWLTVDPMAEKYYPISPYVYVGNSPVKYVDLKGDSISLAGMQGLDKALGSNYTEKIKNDIQSQTGLTLSVGSNGVITYAKDANGNPVIATTTDAAGNTLQSGSATARSLLIGAIDHQDMITVEPGRTSGVPPGTNKIGLNFQQIEGFINGTVNMDNRTLGWGMTLMHEINHTNVGGDYWIRPTIQGLSLQK